MPLPVESVWDYPRPPKLEPIDLRLLVSAFGRIIADTTSGYRVLETSHPPTYYIPPADAASEYLIKSDHTSYCEFKGYAVYHSISVGDDLVANAAWRYPEPTPHYSAISGFLSF